MGLLLTPDAALKEACRLFEARILDYVLVERNPSRHAAERVVAHAFMASTFGDEANNIGFSSLWLVGITLGIMIVYATCFLATQTRHPGHTQIILVLCLVMIAGVAGVSALGWLGYFGMRVNLLCFLTPFLVLCVGIDDVFVLVSSVKEVSHTETNVPRVIGKAMAEGGTAITVTTLTSLAAFSVAAATSSLPGFISFNVSLAVALFVNFLSLVLIFPALARINENSMAADREKRCGCFCWRCKCCCHCACDLHLLARCDCASALRRCLTGPYTRMLTKRTSFQCFCAALMVGVVATSGWGSQLDDTGTEGRWLKTGMPDRYFVTDSSYANHIFEDSKDSTTLACSDCHRPLNPSAWEMMPVLYLLLRPSLASLLSLLPRSLAPSLPRSLAPVH
jgi:hypothetical protein